MSELSWTRDLYIHDNLPVLRGLETDSVDLIYLDPPFNSKKAHRAPIGSRAEGQMFVDTWRWNELNTAWLGEIDRRNEALAAVIRASNLTLGHGASAYLTMIGIRLLEMQRVLKPNGSIYLHCDDTAGAYLRACMDAVFKRGFKNEIFWRRSTSHNDGKKYGRVVDNILFFINCSTNKNNNKFTWNPEEFAETEEFLDGSRSGGLTEAEIEEKYPLDDHDGRGRYYKGDLTGADITGGESGRPWKEIDPGKGGRHWAVPRVGHGRYAEWIGANVIPGYAEITGVHARLDALYNAGMVILPKKGRWPALKRYADSDTARMPQSLILEPMGFTNYNKKGGKGKKPEYTGWKTQKPLNLLRPIVRVSSNAGDLVLDPFCGCATACVAAEMEGRQWIGIDACKAAEEITKIRLSDVSVDWEDENVRVITEPPPRVDIWQATAKAPRKYRSDENKDVLYGNQRGDCPGCGGHYRMKDFHVDHIIPQSDGGGDEITNLQLLCGHCNSTKQKGTMEDVWARHVENGILLKSEAEKLRRAWEKKTAKPSPQPT